MFFNEIGDIDIIQPISPCN